MWIISGCLLLLVFSECLTTKITNLEVPPEVLLAEAEVEELLLDCEYELESDEGMVLTWHFNEETIYQWIMGSEPTAKESFKKYIDLGFNVSDVPSEKYRAMRLLNPDKSLSGEYTCKVSTFVSEDSQKKRLQFYDPGDELSLTYSVEVGNDTDTESDDLVVLLCDVDRVFPQPELTIFVDEEVVNQTQTNLEAGEEGYNSTAIATLSASQMTQGALLRCEMTLPHTTYNNSDAVKYTESEWTSEAAWLADSNGSAAAMELATDSPEERTGGASSATGSAVLLTAITAGLLQLTIQTMF